METRLEIPDPKHKRIATLVCLLAGACWLPAQDSRGSITGKVTDPQGAAVPGAIVAATNVETNVAYRTTSNAAGFFESLLLNPGRYTVSVEAPGFSKSVRTGLVLNVAGRLELDFQLQVGQVTESVEVVAESPLLETARASGGRVITEQQLLELPFTNMNPLLLTGLASGMQWTGRVDPSTTRLSDNSGTSAFNTAGGVGQNEYTMDGAPVTGINRAVGFVPPSEAVAEFRLETSSFDASYGHTSGATVNVMTKSGTNTYHGGVYNLHWQQRWNATPHFTRLAFEDAVRQGKAKPGDEKQASGKSNNFGASLGGPVRIPRLYSGLNRLFFFFNYNGNYESKPQAIPNRTVPKTNWRTGDFSDLLAVDATRYTVYDPRSGRASGSRVVRTPFPENKGIPVLNPIYEYYTGVYPAPNDVPGVVSPDGASNYYDGASRDAYRFNSIVNRYDYNISEWHRLTGRWYWNRRLTSTRDWAFTTRPGLVAVGQQRFNQGAGGNYIWIVSSSTLMDVGVSYAKFSEGTRNLLRTSIKPSEVGLPQYIDVKAGAFTTLPTVEIGGVETIALNGYPSVGNIGTTGEIKAALSTVVRTHSLKYGWNERRYWFSSNAPAYSSGRFAYANTYTRAADNTTTAGALGLSWAAFMMALPSTIQLDTNDSGYFSNRYRSFFLQDDWRVSKRLHISLGLRYERETGIRERFNRAVLGGFLADAKMPFADLAQAAYARNPVPELAASQFKVAGGNGYLGVEGDTYTKGTHQLLPRAGLVYQLNSRSVFRAGYGMYSDTLNPNNLRPNQTGYSQPTLPTVSNDNGLSFCCGTGAAAGLNAKSNPMIDPFSARADGTRFDAPYGNRLGVYARVGQSGTYDPWDFRPALQHRWRLGLQREVATNMVVEVSWNGARAAIPAYRRFNALPAQYWATGNVRNQLVDDDRNANVRNPFQISNLTALESSDKLAYSYLATQSFFTSSTIRKHQLLRPYPHLGTLTGVTPGTSYTASRGVNRYNDFQLQFERRFSRGFQTAVMYTRADGETKDYYPNEFDTTPTWHANNELRPHRFVWSSILELPFGKGRAWAQRGFARHLAGGWQLSWVYQYQSGPATAWSNRFYYGDIRDIAAVLKHDESNGQDMHKWFDPSIAFKGSGAIPSGFSGFEGRTASQPGSYHVRVFPDLLTALRADGIRNWDVKLMRSISITEQLRARLAVDLLNATNHTNFSPPNVDPASPSFGLVTAQNGVSRIVQLILRVEF